MMIAAFRPLAALVAAAAFASPALAEEIRQPREVTEFTAIHLAAPLRVELTQGPADGLVLVGHEDALAEIEATVEEGVLRIRQKARLVPRITYGPKVRALVSARRIDALSISGSGDIRARALKGGSIRLSINGSGDIGIAALESDSAEVSISGSGDVRLAGRTGTLSTTIAGSGDVRCAELEARRIRVSIAGSGDATVWARESLEARVSGSGDVRYYGDPAVERSIRGSGSVRRLGAAPA